MLCDLMGHGSNRLAGHPIFSTNTNATDAKEIDHPAKILTKEAPRAPSRRRRPAKGGDLAEPSPFLFTVALPGGVARRPGRKGILLIKFPIACRVSKCWTGYSRAVFQFLK